MGLFDKFTFDKKPLTKEAVEAFSGNFPDFVSQFKSLESKQKTTRKTDWKKFEALWGFRPNNELVSLTQDLEKMDYPNLSKWESNAIHTDMADFKGNIMKEILLKAQIEYPTDNHIEWFCGAVALDSVTNAQNQWSGSNLSYLYPIVEAKFLERENPHIYLYTHNNPDGWGTTLEVLAKDTSSFLYIVSAVHALGQKKISNNDFFTCYEKAKDKVKLPYYFFNSFRANNRWISTYDFNYSPGNQRGNTITQDYFNRARWIIELLKGNHNNYLWSIQHSFYQKYLNPELTDEIHSQNMEHLPIHVPDALYYLFRCFFRKENEQLRDYIRVCKDSPSRIIRDAAELVQEFDEGLEFFGEVDNLQRLRNDFNQNMNW